MSALIFLVIGTSEGNLFSFLSQLAYNSGILSKFAPTNSTIEDLGRGDTVAQVRTRDRSHARTPA